MCKKYLGNFRRNVHTKTLMCCKKTVHPYGNKCSCILKVTKRNMNKRTEIKDRIPQSHVSLNERVQMFAIFVFIIIIIIFVFISFTQNLKK